MTRIRLICLGLGAVFGFMLAWGRISDPDVIRDMLLLNDAYLYLLMGASVVVGFTGVRLVKRFRDRALLADEPLVLRKERPERRHIIGSMMFGIGWGVANQCPGPLLAQVGQGVTWGLWTLLGVVTGVYVFLRRQERASEPAETASAAGPSAALASAPE
jgi:uncharacterized membrane protein YedE/YeeE